MRSDLALQAPATDALMRASQVWAPVNHAPMRFGPGFDLDTALEPIYVPLHARWIIEDQATALMQLITAGDTFAVAILRLIAFLALVAAAVMYAALAARSAAQQELRWTQDELAECETLLGDKAASLFDVRDALRRRQYGEALYLADRALEVV